MSLVSSPIRSHRQRFRGITAYAPIIATLFRRGWRLLAVMALAIIVMTTIICAVTPFTAMVSSAGLRQVLTSTPASNAIGVHSILSQMSASLADTTVNETHQNFQDFLHSYVARDWTWFFDFAGNPLEADQRTITEHNPVTLSLITTDLARVPSSVQIVAGHLPRERTDGVVEILLPVSAADQLKVQPGDRFTLDFLVAQRSGQFVAKIPLEVAGTMKLPQDGSLVWSSTLYQSFASGQSRAFTAVAADHTLYQSFGTIAQSLPPVPPATTPPANLPLAATADFYGVTHLNPDTITIDQLPDVINTLDAFRQSMNSFQPRSGVDSQIVFGDTIGNDTSLIRFQTQAAVPQIPAMLILIQMMGIALLFVSLISELYLERQMEAIAILRSRGATGNQLFLSLSLAVVAIALVAFGLGPALATPVAQFLASHLLAQADQPAVQIVARQYVQNYANAQNAALLVALVFVAALEIGIVQVVRLNVLALRRSSARTGRRPFWQRWNLDLALMVVAFGAYAMSTYINNAGVLTVQTQTFFAPVLAIAPVLLLIGIALLVLRTFTTLLRLSGRLASRSRGAVPLLAIGQIARDPLPVIRLTLLFSLALALLVSNIVYIGSQLARPAEVANERIGADFSAIMTNTNNPNTTQPTLAQLQTTFQQITGVQQATVLYHSTTYSEQANNNIDLLAVDPTTFGQTVIWPDVNAKTPVATEMQLLKDTRIKDTQATIVPAIVNASLAQVAHLHAGSSFTLQLNPYSLTTPVTFIVVSIINHTPTTKDDLNLSGSINDVGGSVLVDFVSYDRVYRNVVANATPLQPNKVLLRTQGDSVSLKAVRAALFDPARQLSTIQDRRALIVSMQHDPSYLGQLGVNILSIVVLLLLALTGAVIASWQHMRGRLTHFAVLRAIGTTPGQIARILLWEEGIIYTLSIVVGLGLGVLLALTLVPTMVITNFPLGKTTIFNSVSPEEYFALQHTPAIHLVLPAALWAVAGGVILFSLVLVTGLARFVARPSIAQTLRLNQD